MTGALAARARAGRTRIALVAATVATIATVLLCGCDRELRRFDKPANGPAPPAAQRSSDIKPGENAEGLTETAMAETYDERNAYDIAQGKRLFRWYNCSGCHARGGGGMGPALMDDKWRYGHAPEQIFATILEGRPNGMPSFRGRIPSDQVWQLVAYVRSMSGLVPKDAAPGRSDSLGGATLPESRRPKAAPHDQPPPPPS
jgi:cytochrome c oxidase cbb3-type subunit 3